jgi:hypothetical protein
MQAAAVATARKLAVLCWHLIIKGEDPAFALPSLIAHKQRKPELRAGAQPARGRKGHAPTATTHQARVDIFIRGADDGPDLPVEGQERHELGPGVLPQPYDGRVAASSGTGREPS